MYMCGYSVAVVILLETGQIIRKKVKKHSHGHTWYWLCETIDTWFIDELQQLVTIKTNKSMRTKYTNSKHVKASMDVLLCLSLNNIATF